MGKRKIIRSSEEEAELQRLTKRRKIADRTATREATRNAFGLPVPLFADSTSHIKIQSQDAQIMKEYDLIIWDESPMAPRYFMEVGNRIFKYLMDNDLPFGGKAMLVGGDFRQLLPVKMNATRTELHKFVDVDEINSRVVELLDKRTEKIYTRVDSTEICDNGDIEDAILPEYLQSLNPPNFPPHELKLRTNCVVMLFRNLSIAEGSRGAVQPQH
ncbi:uncharacterized protein LOC122852535 [Aphidius gifuensis]|uniref:uncharacterized protein LOC122852535 n=1 Tax=Aphidius gifuensis TaxID=684658 RepID=UPI001CDD80E3|nr:uncharacterized protein LOC122852535 [Aphidius gifuensis]